MKVNFREAHLKPVSLLSHIILNGLVETLKKEKDKIITKEYEATGVLDIKLTVNDVEIDVEKFCGMWQKQVDDRRKEIISKYVKEHFEDKMHDINDLIYDLEGRLKEEINKRLEDWEKE
jgi:cell fate (sporulation/competence/biofilm development) regulator YmcA (YheA/YmcA/DUF963 family)